jgi:hypothetical protein
MGVEGRGEDRARRLARERAVYEYTSALDRGDFDAVAAVLRQAEVDQVLEQMILEVNEAYRVEPIVEPAVGRRDGRRVALAARWADWRRRRATEVGRRATEVGRRATEVGRRGGEMGNAKGSSKRQRPRSGRRLSPGLIAGAVVAVVLVACLGTWIVQSGAVFSRHSLAGLQGADEAASEVAWDVAEEGVALSSLRAPGLVTGGGEAEEPDTDVGQRSYLGSEGQPAIAEVPQERLIVRNGVITLRVEDTLAAQQAIKDLVARWSLDGAYVVSSEQGSGGGGQDPYISMAIRVPAARFGEAMDAVAELAVDVVSRSESSQDVTEEYVDLAGRLEALEAARDRLLAIMSEADRTEDVLQAEEQVTRREEEIEATQGRMQYLAQSAALARISIQLQPYVLSQPVGDRRWRPLETAREALEALLDSGQGFIDFALFFCIAVLPWLLAVALGLYLLYRFVRWVTGRRQARQQEPGAEQEA